MNQNRLARSHGFFNWDELVRSAKDAKKLRAELRDARQLVLPMAIRAERVEECAVALLRERKLIASEWRKLADFCDMRAELLSHNAGQHRKHAAFATSMAAEVESGERAR